MYLITSCKRSKTLWVYCIKPGGVSWNSALSINQENILESELPNKTSRYAHPHLVRQIPRHAHDESPVASLHVRRVSRQKACEEKRGLGPRQINVSLVSRMLIDRSLGVDAPELTRKQSLRAVTGRR